MVRRFVRRTPPRSCMSASRGSDPAGAARRRVLYGSHPAGTRIAAATAAAISSSPNRSVPPSVSAGIETCSDNGPTRSFVHTTARGRPCVLPAAPCPGPAVSSSDTALMNSRCSASVGCKATYALNDRVRSSSSGMSVVRIRKENPSAAGRSAGHPTVRGCGRPPAAARWPVGRARPFVGFRISRTPVGTRTPAASARIRRSSEASSWSRIRASVRAGAASTGAAPGVAVMAAPFQTR